MPQGDGSDEEVAKLLVRVLVEAFITKDHDTVGHLAGGIPGDMIAKRSEQSSIAILRLVSVGEPVSVENRGRGALGVPCDVEVRDESGIVTTEPFRIVVRPAEEKPDIWVFVGGF
jgi:hypothetical protein